jgi:hypothetical protein
VEERRLTSDETLEGQLPDQELGGLLVLSDLTYEAVEKISKGTEMSAAKTRMADLRRATVPGLYLWGFLTPPVEGAVFLAALEASCFRGLEKRQSMSSQTSCRDGSGWRSRDAHAFPPVDFRAVCLVRAIVDESFEG